MAKVISDGDSKYFAIKMFNEMLNKRLQPRND